MSNLLIDVMKEFGVEVRMLGGTDKVPSKESVVIADMLLEICKLREQTPSTPIPFRGAAEIEPKPQDGRRLENRIMSMETKITQNAINFNHISECIGDLGDSRSALEQQIASLRADLTALKEMHCMLDAEVKHHTHKLGPRLIGSTGLPDFPFVDTNPEADYIADTRDFDDVDVPTPPQPTAVCPKCNNQGTIVQGSVHGLSVKPCDCGRAPIMMNDQPTAPSFQERLQQIKDQGIDVPTPVVASRDMEILQPTAVCGCGNPDPNHRHRIPGFESQPTAVQGNEAKWSGSKWDEVVEAYWQNYDSSNEDGLMSAFDKAIELGLAARPISADDEGLQKAVIDALPRNMPFGKDAYWAKRILDYIAAAQQEVSK